MGCCQAVRVIALAVGSHLAGLVVGRQTNDTSLRRQRYNK